MQATKRDAFLQAIKTWLFPPQPLPQVFLNLLTTDNLRSPQTIKVSLQVNRTEIASSSAKITEKFTNDFTEWTDNYPIYAVKLQNESVDKEINTDNGSNFRKPQPTIGEQSSGSRVEFSIEDAAERVERSINALFDSEEFREIRDQIIKLLPPKGQPQPNVYIRYDDPHLAELPLHLWDKFQERDIEPVFSSKETKPQKFSDKKKHKPRILLILGDFIDIDNDNEKLNWQKEYSNADIKVLELLNEKGINNALLKEKWDVLYFGGHSTTEYGKGILYLKDGKRIVLDDFQRSLTTAAQNGLQLVILNSCNSLGAAHALQSAGVPMVVATRHLIHNSIAPEFLEYFLDSYLNIGQSLKDAVGHARYLLRSQHPEFPCASWLPVVFQSPSVAIQPKPSPLIAIATSFFVTCLVISIHTLGLFQSAELNLYDHMMNARAVEPLDPRIVLIHIDKQDQEWQESQGAKLGHESIDDEHLAQLLKRLDEEKPKVIGISLIRKNTQIVPDENKFFIDNRTLSDSLPTVITNCSFDSMERGYFPEIMKKRDTTNEEVYPYGDHRIGFTNITVDSKFIGNTRRLLLMQNLPNSYCGEKTWISFPLRIVLSALDIQDKEIEVNAPKDRFFLKFKNVEISNIVKGQGGYQIDPSPSGDDLAKRLSILFNYKNNVSDIVPISLKSVLTRRNISLKDKIVIIGGIGKDTVENINNIYLHTLAVNYLLQVFEGGYILQGVENNIYFFAYCYILILLVTLLVQYLCNNLKHIQFSIFFFVIVISSLTLIFVNFKILENLSIWIPSIPILVGILISCLVLSMYYQKFDGFVYKK